jgi:rhamnulokinase
VDIFPKVAFPGTRLGTLCAAVAERTGLDRVAVVLPASHDTGSAVAAVPTAHTGRANWAYISSGTWSLMGVELVEPLITDACRELNFTNELGYGGTVRLLKNIVGLWIVQECRREWAQDGHDYDYPTLAQLAALATPFVSLIDPSDPRFLSPGEMSSKIASFCAESGQQVPSSRGMTIRCVLESLALLYRRTLRQIEQLIGKRIEYLHVVGGGCRNMLLNQFTANALQIPVLAGPVEATAAGNILVQAIALGDVSSLPAARRIIRDSLKTSTIEPTDAEVWEQASERFEKLVSNPPTELTVGSRPGSASANQSLNPKIFQD